MAKYRICLKIFLWNNFVKKLIDSYNGNEAFDTHTAFIGFLQEAMDGENFIERLDSSFGAICKVTNKRKTLRSRLRDPARYLSTYLGSVFETFIVAPCASSGIISDYEPRVGSNKEEDIWGSLAGLYAFKPLQIENIWE